MKIDEEIDFGPVIQSAAQDTAALLDISREGEGRYEEKEMGSGKKGFDLSSIPTDKRNLLFRLGLLRRDDDGSIRLRDNVINAAEYGFNPADVPVEEVAGLVSDLIQPSEIDKKAVSPEGNNFLGIRPLLQNNSLFLRVLRDRIEEAIDAPPLPHECNRHGAVAGYLRQFRENQEILRHHVESLNPFLTLVGHLHTSLRSGTETNKIGITYDAGMPVNRKLIRHFIENYPDLTGSPVRPFKMIDFPKVFKKLDYSHIALDDEGQLEARLQILEYIFEGKEGPLLTQEQNRWAKVRDKFFNRKGKPKLTLMQQLQKRTSDTDHLREIENFREVLRAARDSAVLWINYFKSDEYKPFDSIADDVQLRNSNAWKRFTSYPSIFVNKSFSTAEEEEGKKKPIAFRNIQFQRTVFTDTVSDVVKSDTQEVMTQFRLRKLLQDISTVVSIPSIGNLRHLASSLLATYRGANDSTDEILGFIFESFPSMTYKEVLRLLPVLRKNGIQKIPPVCVERMVRRFKVPQSLIDRYHSFRDDGKEKQMMPPTLPNGAKMLTKLEDYLELDESDTIGVKRDLQEMVRLLEAKGRVCIVDDTHYEKSKVDGEHIPVSKRILNSFLLKLNRGDFSELDGYSVVTIERGTETPPLLAMLFGMGPETGGGGVEIKEREMRDFLTQLKSCNPNTILYLETNTIKDSSQLAFALKILNDYGMKLIVSSHKSLPGMPVHNILPIIRTNLIERVTDDVEVISRTSEQHIAPDDIEFVAEQVSLARRTDQDPLHLVLDTIRTAASASKAAGRETIARSDMAAALSYIFNRVDVEKMKALAQVVEDFGAEIKDRVIMGQDGPIDEIIRLVSSHLRGLRNNERPLTIYIPGPTGIGKTLVGDHMAKHLGLPFRKIEGSAYREEHSVSKLTGSPPGYVGGDDGVLSEFFLMHETGVIFIDEFDKMHPNVQMFLLNVFWEGEVTNGEGETFRRPGMIIMLASNAGADRLKKDMTPKKVNDTVAESFKEIGKEFSRVEGSAKPEMAARFDIVPMLTVDETSFKKAIATEIENINNRSGFINKGIAIEKIDPEVVDYVFEQCKELCLYKGEGGNEGMGFSALIGLDIGNEFYDLRKISRILDKVLKEPIAYAEECEEGGFHLTMDGEGKVVLERGN